MVKFWCLCDHRAGEIEIHANPATEEAIIDAGWFARNELPSGHIFPAILRDAFWNELASGLLAPKKLPLQKSIF